MNFYCNVRLCLPGIQTLDSLQTQTSLRILMEGVQTQLRERYRKQNVSMPWAWIMIHWSNNTIVSFFAVMDICDIYKIWFVFS